MFCGQCGFSITETSKFCPQCGAPVSAPPPAPAAKVATSAEPTPTAGASTAPTSGSSVFKGLGAWYIILSAALVLIMLILPVFTIDVYKTERGDLKYYQTMDGEIHEYYDDEYAQRSYDDSISVYLLTEPSFDAYADKAEISDLSDTEEVFLFSKLVFIFSVILVAINFIPLGSKKNIIAIVLNAIVLLGWWVLIMKACDDWMPIMRTYGKAFSYSSEPKLAIGGILCLLCTIGFLAINILRSVKNSNKRKKTKANFNTPM